jgi:AcrR family transcriptional regulator
MKPKINIDDIYEAALKVFAEFGFKKATVDDIAGKLGLTKGALYVYVKSKQDLYRKTVRYALVHWQGRVREAVFREQRAENRFFALCRAAIDHLDEARDFRQILTRDPDIFPMFTDSDPFEDINRDSVLMIRTILTQGIRENTFRPVNVERSADAIFSIYKMFIIRTYIQNPADREKVRALFEETLALLTEGLFSRQKGGVA